MKTPYTPVRQRGLTLVELMIAMALGVLLTLAALQLFATNQRGFQLQQTISGLQEDGQMAIRYITADIRNAGLDSADNGTRSPVTVSFDDPLPLPSNGSGTDNDELMVVSWGTVDCQGTVAGAAGMIANRYFVTNEGILSCEGSLSGGTTIELLPNVEGFQVQYGVDLNRNGTLEVNRYLNADELDDDSVITAIRFAILLSSPDSLPVAAAEQDYYLLDTRITSPEDRRIRRLFTTTVQIRNYPWEEI